MNKFKLASLLVILVSILFFAGCSDDKGQTVDPSTTNTDDGADQANDEIRTWNKLVGANSSQRTIVI